MFCLPANPGCCPGSSDGALHAFDVTWEREDSTLVGQLGDEVTSRNDAKLQTVLDATIGSDDQALLYGP